MNPYPTHTAPVLAAAMIGLLAALPARTLAQGGQHVDIKLVCEHASLEPGTETTLGFVFEIDKGWHIYWNGRNDSGMAPSIELELPEGYEAGQTLWPAPKRHALPGDILDHVYEERVTLLVPVKVPADAQPGKDVTFKADLRWLVCEEMCVLERGGVELTLPVRAEAPEASSPSAKFFSASRARLAKPLIESGDDHGVTLVWDRKTATITAEGAEEIAFYPAEDCVEYADPIKAAHAKDGTLTLKTEGGESNRLRGIIEFTSAEGDPVFYGVDLRVGEDYAPQIDKGPAGGPDDRSSQ